MFDNTKMSTDKSRRHFLASSAGALGGLVAMPNVSVAKETIPESAVTHGTRHVVNLKVSYPDASDEIPRGFQCVRVPDSIVSESGLFAVSAVATDFTGASSLLRTPTDRVNLHGSTTFKETTPYANVTYHGSSEGILRSESPVPPVEVDTVIEDGHRAVVTVGNQHLNVPPETEQSLSLSAREFELPVYGEPEVREIERPDRTVTKKIRPIVETKMVSATPKLTVQNSGQLTVYGTNDGTVLPSSETRLVQSLIGSAEATVQQVEDTEIIVIRHDYDENGGEQ